jgi:hypothetical protein
MTWCRQSIHFLRKSKRFGSQKVVRLWHLDDRVVVEQIIRQTASGDYKGQHAKPSFLARRSLLHRAVQSSAGAALLAAAFTSPTLASAATITSLTPETGVSSVPTASLGSQGYLFYGTTTLGTGISSGTDLYPAGASASSPVSYVTVANGTPFGYGGAGYATSLTVNNTTVQTGVVYNGNNSPDPVTLATITLTETGVNGSTTSGAPVADFTLGVLMDNFTSTNDESAVLVTLSNGTSGTSDSANLSQSVNGNNPISNDFYLFTISGAHVGDTVTIAPTAQYNNNEDIGGLTFDAAVPEPSGVLPMIVVGAAALRRRARSIRG